MIVRRSIQVTGAASVGFYAFLYGFGQPVSALYALFAPIALGVLSAIPGTGRPQASVTLKTLPVGAALVALGTALAASTATAVAGMLVVGFLLSFGAVAGPRAAGAAPGLQLLYILACFPPYAPQTLGARLAGLVGGTVLLALCQVWVLPGQPAVRYRERLADALETAAEAAAAPARADAGTLRERSEGLRLSQVSPGERPAGPGRRDRALAHAGAATRRVLDLLAAHTASLAPRGTAPALDGSGGVFSDDGSSGVLLDQVARMCTALSEAVRGGVRPPAADALEGAIRRFQSDRLRSTTGPRGQGLDSRVVRRQAVVLALAESAWIAATAVGIAAGGRRTAGKPPHEIFWYANLPAPRLWARRIAGNLTHRSVWFQNAVRIACGLAAARLVAGTLDLTHGFWVLLAVLTLGRTTAGATWQAVRLALLGTLVGAVVAGALLIGLGRHVDAYAILLVPGMLIAFALGPRLGVAYAQGLFTLVVALVFAQIAPTTWRLSEARLVDVVTGSAIGLVCGLVAWPAGARREVHRTMAGLLRSCGALVPVTVDALLAASAACASSPGTPPPQPPSSPPTPETLPTLHHLRLAEAAYAQFRSEPPTAREGVQADWHGVLILAHETMLGAQRLPRFEQPVAVVPPGAGAWAHRTAAEVAADADRIAVRFTQDGGPAFQRSPDAEAPPAHLPALPEVVDLELWLAGLDRRLGRIERSLTPGG